MQFLQVLLLLFFHTSDLTLIDPQPLYFDDTSQFRVAVFTDLHYGDDLDNSRNDQFQETIIQSMLSEDRPIHLVIFNGDLSSDYVAETVCFDRDSCKAWWVARWNLFTGVVRRLGIPYALNLGNHDSIDRHGWGRDDILQYDIENGRPLSQTRLGPSNISHSSNYYVPIFNSDQSGAKLTALMWMLDSGKEGCLGAEGWSCVLPDQIECKSWRSALGVELPFGPTE
jgi:hypothetical protein